MLFVIKKAVHWDSSQELPSACMKMSFSIALMILLILTIPAVKVQGRAIQLGLEEGNEVELSCSSGPLVVKHNDGMSNVSTLKIKSALEDDPGLYLNVYQDNGTGTMEVYTNYNTILIVTILPLGCFNICTLCVLTFTCYKMGRQKKRLKKLAKRCREVELCSPMYILGEPEYVERQCGYDLGEEHSREPATTPLNQQPHPTETPTVPKSLAPATPTDHLSHPPNFDQQSCPSPCNPQHSVSAPLYQEPYSSDGSIGQFDLPTVSQALPTRQKQRTKGQHIPIENSDDRSNVDCEGYYKLYSPGSLERSIMTSEILPPRTTVREIPPRLSSSLPRKMPAKFSSSLKLLDSIPEVPGGMLTRQLSLEWDERGLLQSYSASRQNYLPNTFAMETSSQLSDPQPLDKPHSPEPPQPSTVHTYENIEFN